MKGTRRWKTVARELGISAAHLSEVMHDKQSPGLAMLKALGLKRVVKISYEGKK
jgi:transcriptional regulator with XRE-family HTH domain